MDKTRVSAYFKRIGLEFDENEPRDARLLKKLQYAHVTTVPYENTEIVDGHPLSLETDDLFRKVVTEHRGGYCFELNGIFGWLLRELGYEITEHFGRFLRGEDEPPKPRHRVLVAHLDDEKYICDVGVGSKAPRYPLLMTPGVEQEQFGETYFIRNDDFLGTVVMEKNGEKAEPFFSFNDNRQLNKDFYTPSFYCEKHPDSIFLVNMFSIKTADGRYTVDKDIFKVWKNGTVVEERQLSPEELEKVCVEYFGMPLHR